MLSLPISTLVFRSGENERSCGGAPIIAPCPIKLSVPIVTSPSMTTCDCTIVLSPITTCRPLINNAPLSPPPDPHAPSHHLHTPYPSQTPLFPTLFTHSDLPYTTLPYCTHSAPS